MNNKLEEERSYSHKEFAIGSPFNRAIFGTKKDEERLIGRTDCYTSVFDHSSSFLQHTMAHDNSTAGYQGKVRFSFLAVDFDSVHDLELSLSWTRELIIKLEKEYEVNPEHLRYYFSGNKGFHLEIPAWLIDAHHQPSSQYPQIFKTMIQELTSHADLSLYQTLRLYRVSNTKNSKSGLFKIELSPDEILNLTLDEIKTIATIYRRRTSRVLQDAMVRNEKLYQLFSKYLAVYPDYSTEQVEVKKIVTQKIEITGFEKIVNGCSYINGLVSKSERGENLNNQERVVLANLLVRFGEDGRSMLHSLLSKTQHYSREKTDYHLDAIIKNGYYPVSCEMICGNVCETVKLLNRSSCLSLAYINKAEDYAQTTLVKKFTQYRKDIIYSINEDNFYQYRNGVYNQLPEIELASILTSFALVLTIGEKISSNRIRSLIDRLKMETKIQFKGKMNQDGLVNLKNGLYDLDKKILLPHTPTVFTSIQMNFSYNENAHAPKFEKFLNEIFDNDKEKIDYVLNTVCYLLMPDYSYQKVFIFFGSGRNGKSVLTSVITHLLGKENISSVSIHDLAQNRFSLNNLKDKLLNLSSEIGSRDLETEMIKKLSGGDVITADRKYKEPISFVNTARLIINANELPRFSELNDAILERFVLIKFPRTFREEQVNPNLLNELINELPGIFNLIKSRVVGGGGGVYYPIPESIKKERIILLSEISSAAEFINEVCTLNPNSKIKLMELFNSYNRFCSMRGYKALGYKNFKKAVEAGYGISLKRYTDGLCVEGISTIPNSLGMSV